MSRFHCRCRRCDARKVLRRTPNEYVTQPQCNVCGKRDFRIDTWMQTRNTRAMSCFCGGYPFKHRRGSFYCQHRADGTDRLPGHEDFWTRDMSIEQHDELVASYHSTSKLENTQ